MRLDFEVHVEPRGFRESGADVSIVAERHLLHDGTGCRRSATSRAASSCSASDRREHGLAARRADPLALRRRSARGIAGAGITFEAVLGTDADQTAVAPGTLRRTWTEGGRRYFHYATDGPIGSEWAFASANYAVHEARWNDVAIRDLPSSEAHTNPDAHGSEHPGVARLSTPRTSGPYPYRHITVLDVPGDGIGMHADASMLTHGEGVTLMKSEDEQSLDFPFAIVAHEMAHQWAVPIAAVEGAPVVAESVATYYAMKVVETVESVGHEVTEFKPGDEVYGTCAGSFAQYIRGEMGTLAPETHEPVVRARRRRFRSLARRRSSRP